MLADDAVQAGAVCALCHGKLHDGRAFRFSEKFSDWDMLATSDKICAACAWYMTDPNPDLTAKLQREKGQNMRNYSHIYITESWHALSKAQKSDIAAFLLSGIVPEVCCIATSGQKHLLFKARVNPPDSAAGWVLYETQQVFVSAAEFKALYARVDAMYQSGYNKQHLLTGAYQFYPDSDLALWREHEPVLRAQRGRALLDLCVYLVTKKEEVESDTEDDAGDA